MPADRIRWRSRGPVPYRTTASPGCGPQHAGGRSGPRRTAITNQMTPTTPPPAPRVACLMMQKNEGALLDAWAAYHGRLFGIRNLFIHDNGSTDARTLEVLHRLEAAGANVDCTYTDVRHFHTKGLVFRRRIDELEAAVDHGFDFFMPLDCDEFVAVHTPLGMSFEPDAIHDALEAVRGARGVLKIAYSWLNAPGVTHRFFERKESKCFFAAGTIAKLDAGFHRGESRHDQPPQGTAITHVHLHHKPYQRMVELARDKLTGLVEDWSVEGLDRHVAEKRTGIHLPKYLKMSEQEYARSTMDRRQFEDHRFEAALRAAAAEPPFREHGADSGVARQGNDRLREDAGTDARDRD